MTPQCQSQFTPKMKTNVESRLLSSLVWIDHYNEGNGMTSFIGIHVLTSNCSIAFSEFNSPFCAIFCVPNNACVVAEVIFGDVVDVQFGCSMVLSYAVKKVIKGSFLLFTDLKGSVIFLCYPPKNKKNNLEFISQYSFEFALIINTSTKVIPRPLIFPKLLLEFSWNFRC